MTKPRIVIIAAVARNGAIGKDGKLPWGQDLTEDFQHFRMRTAGRPLVMGRGTFDSLPKKPLPGRPNIVMTHDKSFSHEGAIVAYSYDEAIKKASELATEGEIIVIGGASVYKEALPTANLMILTHVDMDAKGDTFFPEYNKDEWKRVSIEERKGKPDGTPKLTFAVYEKKAA